LLLFSPRAGGSRFKEQIAANATTFGRTSLSDLLVGKDIDPENKMTIEDAVSKMTLKPRKGPAWRIM
jgi:hypothetical protein